jgi:dihydroxyacetone kinase-like protein
MRKAFSNAQGIAIVHGMIKVIQDNKQYLSDIDGQIGDGDHGINMNKGFTLCEDRLKEAPVTLSEGLNILSNILMMKIGGSMGPLYGLFFKAMAKESALTKMKDAAIAGRDSTKDMISRIGRSSRLGERSIGVIDAGAASCCFILCAMADEIVGLIN